MLLVKQSLAACAIALVASISSVQAASTIAQEKWQVLAVAKKYAEATACMTTFDKDTPLNERTNIKDVFLMERDPELGNATYYVLWGGDTGCNGGSGTYSSMFSEVNRLSDSRPFLVVEANLFYQDHLSGIEAGKINSRFLSSVKIIDSNQMEVIASNYADEKYGGKDGGNNFPANKFKYNLNFDQSDYKWKVVRQVLLSQEN